MRPVGLGGAALAIGGEGVEQNERRGSIYDDYPYRKVFVASDSDDIRPPTATFSVAVLTESNGVPIDEIEFEYDTVQCTCTYGNY
jgi:hypothetical protein